MAKTPLITGLVASAGRNIIGNGDMQIAQRGTSFSIGTGAGTTKTLDRFSFAKTGTYAVTVTQDLDVPSFSQSGYVSQASMKAVVTTALATPITTDIASFEQIIEGYDIAQIYGRPVRLQFWVKTSLAGTFGFSLRSSLTTRCYVSTYTISPAEAGTWVKRYIDLTMDSAGVWVFNNGIGLRLNWIWMAGPSNFNPNLNQWGGSGLIAAAAQTNGLATIGNYFQIAQVQLVRGNFDSSIYLPFARRGAGFQEELTFCQRYFEKSYTAAVVPGTIGVGGSCQFRASATGVEFPVRFSVEKRASPTIEMYSTATGASAKIRDRSSNTDNDALAGGIGAGGFTGAQVPNGIAGNAYGFQWTADAEF